ncbi:MAG: SAM hydroxide adenosyltransferase, partial [Acidimicrobiales bacterium]
VGVAGGEVEAEVLWVDRFGNVELAAGPGDGRRAGLGTGEVDLTIGGARRRVRRVSAFADLGGGGGGDEVGVMVDANGRLALVCDRRSAATVLGVRAGDKVTLSRPARSPGERP